MRKQEELKRLISVAFGRENPDVIFTNCSIFNVFTGDLENKDIAVCNGVIAGIGNYADAADGAEVKIVDLNGLTVCPGLIDGHIHIESSMLSPKEFAKAVIPHGTTAVVTDPHEIANVAGISGIEFMLEKTARLPMDVYFVLPSCVPATPLDEAGATLSASDLEPLFKRDRVVGLAEMMNAFGTVRNDEQIIKKILSAKAAGKVVDGHGPGLAGNELNAYVAAGVKSDHECMTFEDAEEKLRRGQWIMIRQGTAAKNLEKLMPLFGEKYYTRCLLVTDDKNPGELISLGHIDYIIREAIRLGADPARAIRMASLNAAEYFGLKGKGALAPGYKADFVVVDSIESFNIRQVYYGGELISEKGKLTDYVAEYIDENDSHGNEYKSVYNSFNMPEVTAEDFKIELTGSSRRVIGLVPGEIFTREIITDTDTSKDAERDIVKLALIERHKNTGHIGIGFMSGYGLKKGAIASSVGHDSHNLIVAGVNDSDMAIAANAVRANKGGLAVVNNGRVLGSLPLPIAGLMCEREADEVQCNLEDLKNIAADLGTAKGIDPFMSLSFASLPVIPELRITTHGLAKVDTQSIVPVSF